MASVEGNNMLFVFVGVITGASLGWKFVMSFNNVFSSLNFTDYAMSACAAVVGGALGFLAGAVVAAAVAKCLPTVWTMKTTRKLVALRVTTSVKGNFFLFEGSMKSGSSYLYHYIEDDQIRPEELRIEGNDIAIREVDDEAGPCSIIESLEFVHDWAYIFGMPLTDDRHVFFMPKGAVKEQFSF